MMIPKKIHIVWVGDESKRPDKMIDSWRAKNPSWNIVVWGNRELKKIKWINKKHIQEMSGTGRLCGVADLMRYEILFNHGGFAVDADSYCIKGLEDWLFDSQICVGMENEIVRPGLIANGYLASEPDSVLMAELIMGLNNKKTVTDNLPWITTGPMFLTEKVRELEYSNITYWPSHYFIPEHFTGQCYLGKGHVFANQVWGSTKKINNDLYKVIF